MRTSVGSSQPHNACDQAKRNCISFSLLTSVSTKSDNENSAAPPMQGPKSMQGRVETISHKHALRLRTLSRTQCLSLSVGEDLHRATGVRHRYGGWWTEVPRRVGCWDSGLSTPDQFTGKTDEGLAQPREQPRRGGDPVVEASTSSDET